MIADAQSYLVDVDVLREILTTFWVPFLQSGVHAWSHTVVPMTLVKAQFFDRWHELAKWFADPCCLHTADLVRLSALSFGVWKIVSKNKMDRSRSTALYDPFFDNMTHVFLGRLDILKSLLATSGSDAKWTRLADQVNTNVRRRSPSLPWA
jgi:hypothetical protein